MARHEPERLHCAFDLSIGEARIEAVCDQRDDWREECLELQAAFEAWSRARAVDRAAAYAGYEAALEREEHACAIYRDLLLELEKRKPGARPAPVAPGRPRQRSM